MKRLFSMALLFFCLCAPVDAAFDEVWAYLYKGEEKYFPDQAPFTDIACFSASVDSDGGLSGGHTSPPKLSGARSDARYHLVITIPWNKTLAHLYLNPQLPLRNRIIAAIVKRAKPFDGVQIDFEAIDNADGTNYLNFLAALKKELPPEKIFSVAVLARWEDYVKRNPADAFNYPFVSRFADRVIVMAYDEHYRAGSAGSIASLPWCEKIYNYARKTIDPEKLIMGIPLYGRSWQSSSLARAYTNADIQRELAEKNIRPNNHPETGGHYSYSASVDINVHFETIESIQAKLKLYAASPPAQGIAFWRISQEPAGLWEKAF